MEYTILYSSETVKEDIPKIPHNLRKTIRKAIEQKLKTNPVLFGKPLQYSLKGHRRLRVGDYRIVFRIDGQSVYIVAIKHRKEVYER